MKSFIYSVFFTLILASSNLFAASEIWSKDFKGAPAWQALLPGGDLIVSHNSQLFAYQGSSGNELWKRNDLWVTNRSDIRMLGQTGLFLAEAMPAELISKKKKTRKKRKKGVYQVLTAIDATNGENRWLLDSLRGELIDVRVNEAQGLALVFQSVKTKKKDSSGIYLSAIDLENGNVRWETQYADRSAKLTAKKQRGLNTHAEIVIEEGTAYVPFLGLHAIDMATGKVKWQSGFRKKVPEYMATYAAPLVAGSSVYVSDTGYVYAFDKTSGKQRWRAKIKRAGVIPELQLTDSLLLARFGGTFSNRQTIEGLSSFGVAGIDLANGKVLWHFDDAQDGITNLVVQQEKDRLMFADAGSVFGLSLQNGGVLFAAPLAFYRQYGIFKAKKSGFAIGGGYSKMDSLGNSSGKGGGLGMGGCSFNIGDLPIDIRLKGEEVVIRGQSHIMTFDPRVMLVQWSAIFSETSPSDRTLLYTGVLPVFSEKNLAYYFTQMALSKGRKSYEQMMVLGIDKEDGKVKSRLDIPGKNPHLLMDHARDLLYAMRDGKKKSMRLTAYAL